jgi:outer membrane protein assembly complex protein YaeT
MRAAAAATLLLLALFPAPAHAGQAEDAFGRRVTTVIVELEGVRTLDPGLVDLVEVEPGAPLDAKAVRDTIAHLFSLGRFEDVRVHGVPEAGGVAIRFELVPVRSVERIEFRGRTGLDDGVLRRAVTERFGPAGAATRAGDVVEFLTRYYRDHGYPSPAISARTEVQHGSARATLVFDVDAGARVVVSRVSVEGNAPGSLDDARRVLGFSTGQAYDRAEVDERIAAYVAGLRKRGYYEAQGEHVLRLAPDARSAELVVTIDGGPHVSIEFKGDPVAERVRAELVPIEREGSVDEDLLEDSARRLAEHLREQGYREADVTYARVPKDGELAILFNVTRGPAYVVAGVDVAGNASVPLANLEPAIRLREGEPFLDSALDASVSAVADVYHRRGFADVKVTSAVDPEPGTSPVRARARLLVAEGVRTLVGRVSVQGNAALGTDVLPAPGLAKPGQPYYPPHLLVDRDAILLQYLNRGYRTADVSVKTTQSEDRSRVDVVFSVHEGPQVFVDHVLVVGNEKTSADTIRREVTLKPGDPIGFDGLTESQRRVSALGLFRRVRITEVDHGAESRRDLLVSVEEAPATTIGYGGGVEVARRLVRTSSSGVPDERIEFAPRGFFEIGRRNLFGHNRSVNLFTRVSLRLRSESTITSDGTQPAADFNEYRVLGTYRQPKLFGAFDFLASGFAEQAARTSFDFKREGARAELGRRFGPRVSASLRYALDRTETFNETYSGEDALLVDRLFPKVRLSTVSATLIRDTRDDAIGPTSGTLLWGDGELAAQSIGSEVGFTKTFLQGFVYRRLPGARPLVLATGARLGLARGFAYETPQLDREGRPILGPDGEPLVERVTDLPASERFFAGGDTTVRGFALDQLGSPETIDADGFPRGGNAVVVLNAELRVPVWSDLGAATFVDAGNVFRRASDLDLTELRPTAGFGVRYQSPVGPLRLDFGFKLDRLRVIGGELERRHAWYISFGQAF